VKRLLRRIATTAVLMAAVALLAPATNAEGGPRKAAKNKPTKLSGTVTVSAAASLTEAFTKMGADFRKANPGTTVTFNFAASSALVSQVQGGAPADVFASADGTNMRRLVSGGHVTAEPTVFAANDLTIVVKPGNPEHIDSLADLATVGTLSLCADTVPCGKYAQQALSRAGVTIPTGTVSKGADVKATLAAVSAGDADAAIVCTTGAKPPAQPCRRSGSPRLNVGELPHRPARGSSNRALGKAWIRYGVASGPKTLRASDSSRCRRRDPRRVSRARPRGAGGREVTP
jgi:molybdate transport system substrate-binding protein